MIEKEEVDDFGIFFFKNFGKKNHICIIHSKLVGIIFSMEGP
jgi:hypothetical protein